MNVITTAVNSVRVRLAKLIRYFAVSVVSTITTLAVLGVLVGLMDAPAGWSNVIATTIATVPSFELNRRWVWAHQGQRSLLNQVVPFAALSMFGLALSTLNVHLVATWATQAGWGRLLRTAAVEATNIGTFGVLWVFQYLLCSKVLFRPTRPGGEAVPVGVDHLASAGELPILPTPHASKDIFTRS